MNHFDKTNPDRYHDCFVDCYYINDFCCAVLVNLSLRTKTVCYDDNFFSPRDLLEAYIDLSDGHLEFVECFKDFLKAQGVTEEELSLE